MKIFISQKMRDLTEVEILKRREMIIDLVKKEYPDRKIDVIESWHPDFDKSSIAQLGRSIVEMADAEFVALSDTSLNNIALFSSNSKPEHIKGSEIEALICLSYNIPCKFYTFKLNDNNEAEGIQWTWKAPVWIKYLL